MQEQERFGLVHNVLLTHMFAVRFGILLPRDRGREREKEREREEREREREIVFQLSRSMALFQLKNVVYLLNDQLFLSAILTHTLLFSSFPWLFLYPLPFLYLCVYACVCACVCVCVCV